MSQQKEVGLKDVMTIIRYFVPEINGVGICEITHLIQMGLFECSVDALGQDNSFTSKTLEL